MFFLVIPSTIFGETTAATAAWAAQECSQRPLQRPWCDRQRRLLSTDSWGHNRSWNKKRGSMVFCRWEILVICWKVSKVVKMTCFDLVWEDVGPTYWLVWRFCTCKQFLAEDWEAKFCAGDWHLLHTVIYLAWRLLFCPFTCKEIIMDQKKSHNKHGSGVIEHSGTWISIHFNRYPQSVSAIIVQPFLLGSPVRTRKWSTDNSPNLRQEAGPTIESYWIHGHRKVETVCCMFRCFGRLLILRFFRQ